MAKEQVKEKFSFKEVPFAVLSKEIGLVQKDGQKLRHRIHNVALSIITAWGKRLMDDAAAADLFTALGKAAGYHGKPLANWIAIMLPLTYDEKSERWAALPAAVVNQETFIRAKDEPFWEVSPPPKPQPFDALALLESLLDKNSKKASKGTSPDDKLLPASVTFALRQAIEQAKAVPAV